MPIEWQRSFRHSIKTIYDADKENVKQKTKPAIQLAWLYSINRNYWPFIQASVFTAISLVDFVHINDCEQPHVSLYKFANIRWNNWILSGVATAPNRNRYFVVWNKNVDFELIQTMRWIVRNHHLLLLSCGWRCIGVRLCYIQMNEQTIGWTFGIFFSFLLIFAHMIIIICALLFHHFWRYFGIFLFV